jgi:hypothetical protein
VWTLTDKGRHELDDASLREGYEPAVAAVHVPRSRACKCCDLRFCRTRRDRSYPPRTSASRCVRTQHGPAPRQHRWHRSRPVADASGAPVLRDGWHGTGSPATPAGCRG